MRTHGDAPQYVLLVEDDPISAAFLSTTLERLPLHVDLADSMAAALAIAEERQHALWMIDARLPDGTGAQLLQHLKQLANSPPPAIAHTADDSPDARQTLLAAGFHEVFFKPVKTTSLLALVQSLLHVSGERPPENWNDQTALDALGNAAHVQSLRRLFLDELPGVLDRITADAHDGNTIAMQAELHRLQASCGFVGATRLAAVVNALRSAPTAPTLLAQFTAAAQALLCSSTGETLSSSSVPHQVRTRSQS